MERQTNKNEPNTQQATALRDKITRIILNGRGIRRRVEAAAAKPVKYTADDGVVFDPKWQDEFIGPTPDGCRKTKTSSPNRKGGPRWPA